MDFEPKDVRPWPLTHEPARDERALPDPRDPRGDEDGGGRTRPGVEDAELLGPPEDASETPQRVAPEDRRHCARPDSVELREIEAAPSHERDRGGQVHESGEDVRNLGDPHRRRVEPGSQHFDNVALEPRPELHRLNPALVAQTVDRLADPVARHVCTLSGDQARRLHSREPLRNRRATRMRRRRNPFLGEDGEGPGLVRRRRREVRENPLRRGIKTLPAIPPRHAAETGRILLRVSKKRNISRRVFSKMRPPRRGTRTEPFSALRLWAPRWQSSNGSEPPKRFCSRLQSSPRSWGRTQRSAPELRSTRCGSA